MLWYFGSQLDMYVQSRGRWAQGLCTSLLCHNPGVQQLVVKCHKCKEKNCGRCDGVTTCPKCGLPTCYKHSRDHGCLDSGSYVPLCLLCAASQQGLYRDYSCHVCRQPECFNGNCASQLRTCRAGCRKDVCHCCGSWYFLPAPVVWNRDGTRRCSRRFFFLPPLCCATEAPRRRGHIMAGKNQALAD